MWFAAALALSSLAAEGRGLFEQNRFREARAVLEKAVKGAANENGREARYWLGYTCLALADHECAILQFERIQSGYAGDPEFLFAAGEAYTRRARQLSELLSSLDDRSARRHQHLAHRHLAAGDAANALTELRLAMERNPALAGLHEEAAEIYWSQGKHDEAARLLRRELKINAEAFLANLRLGQHLLQRRLPLEAIPHLRTAVRYHRYPEASQLLAYALSQAGKEAEAQGVIAAGLRDFPDDAGLTEMRKPDVAAANFSPGSPLNENEPAVDRLRTAPLDDERMYWLNKIYARRAEEMFQRLEQAAPDSARVDQSRGLNAEWAEDYTAAEAHYRNALRKAPRVAGLHFALGHVLRLQGKDDEALEELERDIQNELAFYERGLIQIKRGDFADAAVLLEKAVRMKPDFAEAEIELGKAYLQTGQPAKSVPLLKDVISRHADHPTAHYILSRAYRSLGQMELAQSELARHRQLTAPGK